MVLIFNIGSHKTGTKSLRRFLEKTTLKLSNNIKWYNDKNYQNQIINNNYELIKEHIINDKDNIFYEDAPYNINEVYKYLNINFLNSKFILTTRDSDKWFNSFVKWCEEKKLNNGFGGVKKEKMYGAKILNKNKNLIIKNYEERIINIKKYFQNTGKLLVLETDNDKINKIKLICDFLNLDYNLYKDIEYPKFTHREKKMKVISLGHRCHMNNILIRNNLRGKALPFDNIISSFEGVIKCFSNNFKVFHNDLLKTNIEYIYKGKEHHNSDKNGYRYLFRGDYFCFTHHDIRNQTVIETFKKRIIRLNNILHKGDNEILFIRSILDDNEIKSVDTFIKTIKNIYKNLKFTILFIYDNKNLKEKIYKIKNEYLLCNSHSCLSDQNNQSTDDSFKIVIEYLKKYNSINDLFLNAEIYENQELKNDEFKGFAMKDNYPFKL